MDELEVRAYLLDRYEKKNEFHIRNIYTLIAIIFGLILSDKLDYLPKPITLNIYELGIAFSPLFLYFILRARYWSTMVWAIMFVKPLITTYNESSIYKGNLLGQLNHACNIYARDYKEKLLNIIPLRWSLERWFKYACICSFITLIVIFSVTELI